MGRTGGTPAVRPANEKSQKIESQKTNQKKTLKPVRPQGWGVSILVELALHPAPDTIES
jgi:hypothetical protein